ncbi:MAG: hypothetical protein WCP35_02500 [Verrucomicrobiota bacterium]
MKSSAPSRRACGYVSLLFVLSMGMMATLLMVLAYRRAMAAMAVQSEVQLQVDYYEKGEAILRSIVAITPNRAIRAMQPMSNANITRSDPLRWENIFADALASANASQSIGGEVLTALGATPLVVANSGDAPLNNPSLIFKALGSDTGLVSAGINRSLGSGYPVPLTCGNATDATRDGIWPIISINKVYGTLAQGDLVFPVDTYPNFNVPKFKSKNPNMSFNYTKPGDPFVAKRNWWAFSMNLAAPNAATTATTMQRRDFVLSIYEIPSQLPISAASFLELGQYAGDTPWDPQKVKIDGAVFAGRARVDSAIPLLALATRRGAALSASTMIGDQSFTGDPFAPGVRETYQLTHDMENFFPVSLASESGRAAFIPINRGADYFDRFANVSETDVLSSTTWDNYSLGAMQCAMRLDITQVKSAADPTPAILRFSYLKAGIRQDLLLPPNPNKDEHPAVYIYACEQDQTYDFGSAVVDIAYGKNGQLSYKLSGMTGLITFNNARFGCPQQEVGNTGYFKPSYPFEEKTLASGKICIAVYPMRFAAFLAFLQADSTAVNHSLVVNVDYINITEPNPALRPKKPSIPCHPMEYEVDCKEVDYGVILQECSDLTSFSKGFSLVTNLRLYFGDDFNTTKLTPPAGYTPPAGVAFDDYYPPCSIFTPERRYGVEIDPVGVNFTGQIGSVAVDVDGPSAPIRPLDTKMLSGKPMTASQITVNLRPFIHPAALPPIYMMNWLVLLEERRRELNTDN